jgi:hypothetical protein
VRPYRQALQAEALATTRFETPPGRQLQIDFGERLVGQSAASACSVPSMRRSARPTKQSGTRHERLDFERYGGKERFHRGTVRQRGSRSVEAAREQRTSFGNSLDAYGV